MQTVSPPAAPRRSLPHWLLEGVFIVVSVVLGFAVAQYGESRAERRLATRALASLAAELEFNIAMVKPFVPFHLGWYKALQTAKPRSEGQNGYEVFLSARPPVPEGKTSTVPLPRRAAWDTALSTGALRLIDYDLAAELSAVYAMQGHLTEAIGRIPMGATSFFEPASLAASLQQAREGLGELIYTENLLLELYQKALPPVRVAVEGER